MIRISVGIETLDDILWDIDQALHAAGRHDQLQVIGRPSSSGKFSFNSATEGTEVLVRNHPLGVCHSDLHIWRLFRLGGADAST